MALTLIYRFNGKQDHIAYNVVLPSNQIFKLEISQNYRPAIQTKFHR